MELVVHDTTNCVPLSALLISGRVSTLVTLIETPPGYGLSSASSETTRSRRVLTPAGASAGLIPTATICAAPGATVNGAGGVNEIHGAEASATIDVTFKYALPS